jgi:isopentenyl-diphosphate delta-isomerase
MEKRDKRKIKVVLVDKKDKIVGFKEKYEAHNNPVPLHRAISVVIFDKSGKRILLQKRAKSKPTWPLYWSNTCCTHPIKGEGYLNCAKRRLKEEMGISTTLEESFRFIYKARYDKVWGENEYDVVYTGIYSGKIVPDSKEASGYKWFGLDELTKNILSNPDKYTPWLKIILQKIEVI